MQIDFWNHYSIAPVFAVIHKEATEEQIKEKITDSAICIKSEDEEKLLDEVKTAVAKCKEEYE